MMNPGNGNHAATVVQAIIMILLMSGTQFFIQKQLSAKNISEAAKSSPDVPSAADDDVYFPRYFRGDGY